jgi:DNA-binding NarL/FixJ family response regulator
VVYAPSPPGGLVLVVDTDAEFRSRAVAVLRSAGYTTAEAGSREEALTAARALRPLLVLLEMDVGGVSGHQLFGELREACGDELPIVFISGTRVDSYDRAGGLLVGADDYVLKPFAPDELLIRIGRILRRVGTEHSDLAQQALTPREISVLSLLAAGLNQHEIAESLVITHKTVGTHIEHLLNKLGVHSRAQAVSAAYRLRLVERLP